MNVRSLFQRRSLTLKLIAIYIGVSVVGLLVVGVAMRYAFREGFRENINPHLRQYVRYVEADLGKPPQLENARRLVQALPIEIYYRGKDSSWSTSNRPLPRDDDIHFSRRSKYHDSPVRLGHAFDDDIAVINGDGYRLYFVSPDRDDDDWRPVMILPLLLVIAFFFALYYLTQRLFAPLHAIRRAVNRFGDGDLEQRVKITRQDELGEVAGSFNHMADRIQQMLESKRQLLLAISHELRSPLTRAKLATALLDDEKQRAEIDDELSEMETLVNELLETERINAGHQALNLEQLVITDLVRLVVDAIDQPIDIDLPPHAVTIRGDATRLKLVVKNLLENALKYTPEGRHEPALTVQEDICRVVITVRDHGDGIAAEHVEHLGEPFYRVDPARQRATGGYGLGLYLSRMIIEAHGGNLRINSKLGDGTSVSIELPTSDLP